MDHKTELKDTFFLKKKKLIMIFNYLSPTLQLLQYFQLHIYCILFSHNCLFSTQVQSKTNPQNLIYIFAVDIMYKCKYKLLLNSVFCKLCSCVTTGWQVSDSMNSGLDSQIWFEHHFEYHWLRLQPHMASFTTTSPCVYFTLITKTLQHKVSCYLCIYLNIYNYFLFCKN